MAKKIADRRWEESEKKRRAVVEFVRHGDLISEACEKVGWSTSALNYHRSKHPQFTAELEAAKHTGRTVRSGDLRDPDLIDGEPDQHVPADFSGFITRYFEADRRAPMVHQIMLAQALSELRPLEVVLFLLWPGAGKSAVIEDYICRRLALDPTHRFRVVSQTRDHALKLIATVKNRMTDIENYPEFIARFGPFYEAGQERQGKAWAEQRIKVWKNPGSQRDYNVFASSWDAATLGARIDTLILDDVQAPENINDAEKIYDRLTGTFFSREKAIRTIIIGNRVAPGDFYDKLMDAGLISKQIIVPAAGGLGAKPGHPSVPEWWDQEMVHQKQGPCCGGIVPFRDCPQDGTRLTPVEVLELIQHRAQDNWWSLYQQQPRANQRYTFAASLEDAGPALVLDTSRTIGQLAAV